MRTRITIDDELLAAAMKASGAKTTGEAVELGLKALVRVRQPAELKSWRGKLRWTGDLEAMRTDREVGG